MKHIELTQKFTFLLFLVIVLVGFISNCDESTTEPGIEVIESPDWVATLFFSPDIGTIETSFRPHIQIIDSTGSTMVASDFLYSIDYNNDGVLESEGVDSLPNTPSSYEPGKHKIMVIVQDSLGLKDTASSYIHVQSLIQITPTNTSGSHQGNIDWSRDGSNRIAFDAYGGESGANQSIFVIQYPSGEPEKISFNPDSGNYFFDQFPEWSPLGDKIACVSSNGLDIIDVETHERTNLDPYGQYEMRSWSPDGRWLAYWLHIEGQSRTVIHDFTMDTTRVLFDDLYFMTWSPDGSKIARCNNLRTRREYLEIVDFESGTILEEFEIPTHDWHIDWSPTRDLISLGFTQSGSGGYVLNIETGTVYSFNPDGLKQSWYPSWSEDGTLLAFEAKPDSTNVWTSIWAIEFPEDLD